MIEQGIESGEIDSSIDAEGMSILLFALGDGIIARIADDPSFDFQKYFAVFKTVVEGALKKGSRQFTNSGGNIYEQGQDYCVKNHIHSLMLRRRNMASMACPPVHSISLARFFMLITQSRKVFATKPGKQSNNMCSRWPMARLTISGISRTGSKCPASPLLASMMVFVP